MEDWYEVGRTRGITIEPHWKRIAGVQLEDNGTSGAIWLARSPERDVIYVYDSCRFDAVVMAVIAEGLNARGRWIPIAWEKSGGAFSRQLLDRGCNIIPEAAEDSDSMAEVISREILERMQTGRFKIDDRLSEWWGEFDGFKRNKDGTLPRKTHPLMSATRLAMSSFVCARPLQLPGYRTQKFPEVAIV